MKRRQYDEREFRTEVTTLADGRVCLGAHGELDLISAPELERELRTVLRSGSTVVLDLGGITFIDSSGIALLVRVSRNGGGARFHLAAEVQPPVERVLDMTGLRAVLPFSG